MSIASPASDEPKAVDWQAIVAKGRSRLERDGRGAAAEIELEIAGNLEGQTAPSSGRGDLSLNDREGLSAAEAWLFLGQLRELQVSPEKLRSAIEAYEKSQSLAQGFAPRQERLAAMNRGNALSKLGQTDAALVAYDEALGVTLGAEHDAADRLTLGALHLNRGAALETLSSSAAENIGESYRRAIEEFSRVCKVAAETSPEYRQAQYLLAGTRLNLAVNLLTRDESQQETALAVAMEVSGNMAASSTLTLSAADFALRALRLACEISARQIAENGRAEKSELGAWLNRATDWAEDALRLAAHWEQKGEVVFRPAVSWFLSFAAALYTHHQPHFLGEFLTEMLRGDATPPSWRASPELDHVALSAIDAAQTGVRGWLFHDPASAEAQKQISTLENLRRAQAIFQNP